MYDAELKLKYFNDGTTRLLEYNTLKSLMCSCSLVPDDDDNDDEGEHQRGLLRYAVMDYDPDHVLTRTFTFQAMKFYHSNIQTYLTAADKYYTITRLHIVLMKAIAHLFFRKYGPNLTSWTRLNTKDFGSTHVRHIYGRRRRDYDRRWRDIKVNFSNLFFSNNY
ncbi:uncharacterized protein LOC123321874 [Coccinella septempunctata]|uniref:uncharacterized protein LOC123321874 n=1 Tax=Coccinella septempunctata TaxID=41139 RepID=UPI001D08047E|nr:uncharacterized protein LOC123321874 [Coccinella septempunctata]